MRLILSDETILKYFADFIEKQIGIVYSETNYFQLEHRLKDLSHQLGLRDLNDLYAKALSGIEGSFKGILLDLATNNETSFYRDAAVFNSLGRTILPDLQKNYPDLRTVRIWSAAASSGQELYSIAIAWEHLRLKDSSLPEVQFLASDISDTILKRAQEGVYSQLEVQRGLPARDLVTYFQQINENQWRVKDSLRRNMDFKKINLLEPWENLGTFHIVFCRNVLIYQSIENKRKVLSQIESVLQPGGFLILGAAESLFGLTDAFDLVTDDKILLFKKKI